MKSSTRTLLIGTAVAVAAAACIKVPFTHRRQFNLVPDSIMNGLGSSSYASLLDGKVLRDSGRDSDVLNQVGGHISQVANKPGYDWQFRLIDEDTLNAWCLPGGKIGFYTGILPVLRNEAGMAFVMGHEVGHATARHGSERMSQNLAMVGGLGALELYLSGQGKLTDEQRGMVLGVLGVGAQVGVMLPFSRAHETEADIIGLMYMSEAGYPPAESVAVWDRMASATGGGGPPAFLSTHPSHDRRQAVLRDWMPAADKRYARNKLPGDKLAPLWTGPLAPASKGANPPATSTGGSSDKGSSKGDTGASDTPRTTGGNR